MTDAIFSQIDFGPLKEFLDDYSGDIENNLMDEIKMDVMLCSAYQEGYWNKTDIKLAVGRVLCKNLGIER